MHRLERLLLPGPVMIPAQVYESMARPVINHRGPAFVALLEELAEGLRWLFQTEGRVLTFTASGTGAMESAVANCFSREDEVVVATAGSFGDRWVKIARAFGLNVHLYERPWGELIDARGLAAFVADRPHTKGVLVTHSETSTGTVHDLEAIAQALAGHSAQLIVDAVSSVGAVPFRMDAWGIDVAVSGSQKALAAPPGMAFVAVSERAWGRLGDLPRFYFDWEAAASSAERGQTPWTPAVNLVSATAAAIGLIREEGLEAAWERHRRLANGVRAAIRELGLELFSKAADRSNVVTAVVAPEGIDVSKLLRELRERFGVVLAGGQGKLAGKIFRFGHLGRVDEGDLLAGLAALEAVLPEFGVEIRPGAAAAAAGEAWR